MYMEFDNMSEIMRNVGVSRDNDQNCEGLWDRNRQYTTILLRTITDYYSPSIFNFNMVGCTDGWERGISEVLYNINSDRMTWGPQKEL